MGGGERHRAAMKAGFVIVAAVGCAFAATGGMSAEQESRIQRIEDAILAPCCYTEPVSRHQSEVAVKMRIQIAKWVAEGKGDQEILDAYVRRYGSKVLVDPRTKPGWWTPWVPWLGVVVAVVFGFWLLKRLRARALAAVSPAPVPDAAVVLDFDDE